MFDTREDNAIVKYIQHSSNMNSDASWCRSSLLWNSREYWYPPTADELYTFGWMNSCDVVQWRRAQHFKQRQRPSVATVQIIKWKPQSVQAAWTTYSG